MFFITTSSPSLLFIFTPCSEPTVAADFAHQRERLLVSYLTHRTAFVDSRLCFRFLILGGFLFFVTCLLCFNFLVLCSFWVHVIYFIRWLHLITTGFESWIFVCTVWTVGEYNMLCLDELTKLMMHIRRQDIGHLRPSPARKRFVSVFWLIIACMFYFVWTDERVMFLHIPV